MLSALFSIDISKRLCYTILMARFKTSAKIPADTNLRTTFTPDDMDDTQAVESIMHEIKGHLNIFMHRKTQLSDKLVIEVQWLEHEGVDNS